MTYTYINEDQIDIELKCSICDEPFQSPTNCKSCGNTYCQNCIDNWMNHQVSCPSCRKTGDIFLPVISRVVLNQLNRLLVQCMLCKKTNIQRSNFNDHILLTCPKHIINCTDNCGWKGMRENLEEHIKQCPKQIVSCPNDCRWKGTRENLEQHMMECQLQRFLGHISTYLKKIWIVILAIFLFYILTKK